MHSLVSVASRLLAIYLVLVAIRYSSYAFFSFEITESLPAVLWITFVSVVLPLAAAIFLWCKPYFVAKTLLASDSVEFESRTLSESSLFTVLVTVLGLYLVITGGAALVGSVADYLAIRSASHQFSSAPPDFWTPLVRSGLELAFGALLVVRVNGLRKFYFSMKEGGLGEKTNNDP